MLAGVMVMVAVTVRMRMMAIIAEFAREIVPGGVRLAGCLTVRVAVQCVNMGTVAAGVIVHREGGARQQSQGQGQPKDDRERTAVPLEPSTGYPLPYFEHARCVPHGSDRVSVSQTATSECEGWICRCLAQEVNPTARLDRTIG